MNFASYLLFNLINQFCKLKDNLTTISTLQKRNIKPRFLHKSNSKVELNNSKSIRETLDNLLTLFTMSVLTV